MTLKKKLGIFSPESGQLEVRPPVKQMLEQAGTYAAKSWI
jgi:hypothetical protein